jgi:hypothetical protein
VLRAGLQMKFQLAEQCKQVCCTPRALLVLLVALCCTTNKHCSQQFVMISRANPSPAKSTRVSQALVRVVAALLLQPGPVLTALLVLCRP